MPRSVGSVLTLLLLAMPSLPFSTNERQAETSAADPVYLALRQMQPGEERASVEEMELRRDAGHFFFHRGTFYFFAPVMGRTLGAIFVGEGTFTLSPSLEVERQFLAHLTGTSELREPFEEAILYFTDRTGEELRRHLTITRAPPSKPIADRIREHQRVVRRQLKPALELRLLADLYAPQREGFFLCFLKGKKHPKLVFGVDPLGFAPSLPSPEEVGLASYEETTQGIWALFHRNAERASANVEEKDHREYDLTQYRLQVSLDRGGRLDVTAEVTFVPLQPHLRVIRFSLFPKLRVERAWDAAGNPLPFLQADEEEGEALAIIFPEPLPVGVPRTVSLRYGGSGAVRPSGPGNYILIPEARSTWYPNNWQMPFGDRATFELTFTIPRDHTIVATGHPRDRDSERSRWTSEWPTTVAGFNFGLFQTRQRIEEGIALEVYTNPTEPDEIRRVQLLAEQLERRGIRLDLPMGSLTTSGLAENMLIEALNAMRIFTRYFGPNPYGRIALSQQPAAFFGQSWPMLIYLPYTAFLDGTQRRALGLPVRFSEFTDVVGAHEVAHQWWGHIVSWKTYRDQWMSEGFSDFSAALYLQFAFHQDPERRLKRFLDFWKSQREVITQKALLGLTRTSLEPYRVGPLILGVRLNTGRTSGAYERLAYAKGAFVLHMLRMMLRDPRAPLGQGDDRFIALMREFVRTYAHRAASTQDFQRIVEKHMTPEMDLEGNGRMEWFFRQWVYGTAIPHYVLHYRIHPTPDGKHRLWLKVSQSRVPDDFRMLVPVYLDYGEGKLVRLGTATLQGNGSVETEVTLATPPRRVLLNAFEDVLCTKEERAAK
ncbi:MAG: M1 family aminopeptidase [Acidobacteriota bacterium]|nr:M1 family aminopeptidase [Acidobacteriota bacterium]